MPSPSSRPALARLALRAAPLVALACGPQPPAGPAAPAPPPTSSPAAEPPAPPPSASGDAPAAPRGSGWESFGSDPDASPFEAALDQWSTTTQCTSFDYFPRGGIQSFWCHRPEGLTLARVRSLAGVAIFTSGPHPEGGLKLDAPGDFGHYNPAFVRWLVDKAAPAARGSAVQKATQASYEANLRPLAEIFWKTHEKMRADAACFAREKSLYEGAIKRRSLPRGYTERWFFFMNPFFCKRAAAGQGGSGDNFFFDNGFDAGVDGNVTKTVVGFWLRRSMDGTLDTFAEGLKKLVASYQPALLAAQPPPADPDALSRALDQATRAASACKAPRGPQSIYLTIKVSSDGKLALNPGNAPPMVDCVNSALASVRVSPFAGNDLLFNRTVVLR